MTAQELRIGNYVLTGLNSVLKIEGVISEGNTGGYLLETLKPIPITEDWLIKLGFEQVYKSIYHSTYYFDRLSYYIWYENGNQYATFEGAQVEVKNIHQLQNLYFALKGKELTIKP